MGVITEQSSREHEEWMKKSPEERAQLNREMSERWILEAEEKREEDELRARLEGVLKRVTLAQLQGLTVEEFSQLPRVFPSAADWADLRLPHLKKVWEILQKHGLLGNQAPGLNGLA